jgi:hypothetical protein
LLPNTVLANTLVEEDTMDKLVIVDTADLVPT